MRLTRVRISGVSAGVAAVAVVLGAVGCSGAGQGSAATATARPRPEPTSATATATPPAHDEGERGEATPVYFVEQTQDGLRLVGRRRRVRQPAARVDFSGVTRALMRPPADPRLGTRWPPGSISWVAYVEGEFRIQLTRRAPTHDRLADQQLMDSLDAALGRRAGATVYRADGTPGALDPAPARVRPSAGPGRVTTRAVPRSNHRSQLPARSG